MEQHKKFNLDYDKAKLREEIRQRTREAFHRLTLAQRLHLDTFLKDFHRCIDDDDNSDNLYFQVKDLKEQLELKCRYIQCYYKKNYGRKRPVWPKWADRIMDSEIKKMKHKPPSPIFRDIYTELFKRKLTIKETHELIAKHDWQGRIEDIFRKVYLKEEAEKIIRQKRTPVIVEFQVKAIAKNLKVSPHTVWKHVRDWTADGAPLKRLGMGKQKRDRGKSIIVMGYFGEYGNSNLFFTERLYGKWFQNFLSNPES